MRHSKVHIIVGAREHGKTDLIKRMLRNSPYDKKLVVDTFDSSSWRNQKTFDFPQGEAIPIPVMDFSKLKYWKKGFYRCFSRDASQIFGEIEKHVMNAVIVFEDSTKYIGSRLLENVRFFVLDSKQKSLDLFFVFHSFAAIPPELMRYSDYLTMFNTNEGTIDKNKFPYPDINIAREYLKKCGNRFENITIPLN